MKPAAFDYARPRTLPDALALLAGHADAKVLAGGQTLGPMLNLRLAQPALLVDITRIPELGAVSEAADGVTFGAIVTHAAIEDGRAPDPTGGFLRKVAAGIAYRAVRTRGTVGGSLAHADPAADWLSCLAALGAVVLIAGPARSRRVPVGKLVVGAMETGLAAGELITAVHVARFSPRARFGFHKVCRKSGEFADAIGVVAWDPEVDFYRAVAGATQGPPLVMEMRTGPGSPKVLTTAEARRLLELARFAGDGYELALHAAALRRASEEAFAP